MAKDDYFVIKYRLMKYLYECLKKSKAANMEVFDADFFSIRQEYWEYIIANMCEDGYISSVTLFPVLGSQKQGIKISPDVRITPKGILCLEENSVFQRIKGAAKDIADIIPV